jgi:hypothetical protein
MNIRFVSSLTPEDENLVAPALLKALSALFDLFSLPYMIRIDTSDAKTYEHCHHGAGMAPPFIPTRGQIVPIRPDQRDSHSAK